MLHTPLISPATRFWPRWLRPLLFGLLAATMALALSPPAFAQAPMSVREFRNDYREDLDQISIAANALQIPRLNALLDARAARIDALMKTLLAKADLAEQQSWIFLIGEEAQQLRY